MNACATKLRRATGSFQHRATHVSVCPCDGDCAVRSAALSKTPISFSPRHRSICKRSSPIPDSTTVVLQNTLSAITPTISRSLYFSGWSTTSYPYPPLLPAATLQPMRTACPAGASLARRSGDLDYGPAPSAACICVTQTWFFCFAASLGYSTGGSKDADTYQRTTVHRVHDTVLAARSSPPPSRRPPTRKNHRASPPARTSSAISRIERNARDGDPQSVQTSYRQKLTSLDVRTTTHGCGKRCAR